MTEFDAVVAALNDKQKLNHQEVVDILAEAIEKVPPQQLSYDILTDFLRIKQLEGGSKSEVASDMLDQIEESDISFYDEYISDIRNSGRYFIPFNDYRYPFRLQRIPDLPLCLYVDGNLDALNDGVAVVGTRQATDSRVGFVEQISRKLVERNRSVVSGLANGVDEAAHKGALSAKGRTAAVLPGHLDKISPASNRKLGERIRESGALVSEVSSKVSIHKRRFIERNRITSGICDTIIIGASGEKGGTIHQAKFANEQGLLKYHYDPQTDGGQSPTKLLELGFQAFSTLEDLEQLMDENSTTPTLSKNKTLDDY